MKNIKTMLAAALVLVTAVIATGAAADENNAICYFNGQPYSTGAQICMKGNMMRCDDKGEWVTFSVKSPSCEDKPDGTAPGDLPSN